MTDKTAAEAAADNPDLVGQSEPITVPGDTKVVDAPAVVTDPADSSDAWTSESPGYSSDPTPNIGGRDSSDTTRETRSETGTPAGTVHGDPAVDEPVVPSSTDDAVGFQTVGDNSAVVDNAALNAAAAEKASTTEAGFITRGGTKDDSQGTPAGLDAATPDHVHTDGGPTVFTDEEIDRLESLELEDFEKGVQLKLDGLEDQDGLKRLRGRHSEVGGADLSGDTSPQTNSESDGKKLP